MVREKIHARQKVPGMVQVQGSEVVDEQLRLLDVARLRFEAFAEHRQEQIRCRFADPRSVLWGAVVPKLRLHGLLSERIVFHRIILRGRLRQRRLLGRGRGSLRLSLPPLLARVALIGFGSGSRLHTAEKDWAGSVRSRGALPCKCRFERGGFLCHLLSCRGHACRSLVGHTFIHFGLFHFGLFHFDIFHFGLFHFGIFHYDLLPDGLFCSSGGVGCLWHLALPGLLPRSSADRRRGCLPSL
mmetsp:Transcript_10741/g.40355  ORF Transcript_10741/g.40355 Transcript_10741/m.40355 type:complete len:242 (+) Transcript_10741:2172-2897(+)